MTGTWNPSNHLRRPNVIGRKHGLASGHYLATLAGSTILEAGGNAIDAGVCAGITINIVESQQCSFSGVAPTILYIRETGELITIDGLGVWPKAASTEYFEKLGHHTVPDSILTTVVPGAPDSWITALQRYGTMSFADVAGKAITLARDGFAMHAEMAHTLVLRAPEFPEGGEAHKIFFPGGRPLLRGELFYQKDLAASLQYMVDEERAALKNGRDAGLDAARNAFYRGDLSKTLVAFHRANGGLISEEDFAGYRVTAEPPVGIDIDGFKVFSCGPWCQGPMLLQLLAVLKTIDVASLGHNSPAYIHMLVEAIKLVASDRENFYGDPKFVDVPLDRLLSEGHAQDLRNLIDLDHARLYSDNYFYPADSTADVRARAYRDTTYVSAVDKWGNAFSATPSDGVMRCAPVVPGTGMAISPRGIQSRIDKRHPATIHPGKRPRLTPNPAMALKEGHFVMPFGTPGGDLQTQAMLQFLLNLTRFKMSAQAAVEAPRIYSYGFPDSFSPHPIYPNKVRTEGALAPETAAYLEKRGHILEAWPQAEWPLTSVCAVLADFDKGTVEAAADFRRTAYAYAV